MTELSPEAVEVQAPPREKFRRKPLEVEAIQYTGSNPTEVAAFVGEGYTFGPLTDALRIHALWGDLYVFKGHWVVRDGDVDGVTICPPDVFAATYDVAPEPLELTGLERAAAAKSEHMATCHEPVCVECMRELRLIRRIVKAIRPVIADEFERAADAQMAAANDEGYRRGWKDGYGQGRDDEAGAAPIPVAAASNPTDTAAQTQREG